MLAKKKAVLGQASLYIGTPPHMIKTACAKFRKQNHPNNTLFEFFLTQRRIFVYIYITEYARILFLFAYIYKYTRLSFTGLEPVLLGLEPSAALLRISTGACPTT